MSVESERPFAIHTPLGTDKLLLRHLTGEDHLGRCFAYHLTVYSLDHNIALEAVLGQHVTVSFKHGRDGARYFDGIASDFSYVGQAGRYARYSMTLRPWVWLLSHNHDCRVFQKKSVPDIVKEVFREHGMSDFDQALTGSYEARDYCVQYRESDLQFISRLLEEAGIYYFFEHQMGKHVLVLADSDGAHERVKGLEQIALGKLRNPEAAMPATFVDWTIRKQVAPGNYATTDYDFTKPSADISVRASDPRDHRASEYEVYDYPGGYVAASVGEGVARVRLEELQSPHEVAVGTTDAVGLFPGALFELTDHPRADQNREYLIVSVQYDLDSGRFESGNDGDQAHYRARVSSLSSKVPFRPARLTPVPVVGGPQTATVVGQAGNEIWTDEFGRVKVQFHWDRDGKRDENSSCWVRVSQAWAGASWGSMHLPHVGHEVIVSFLEGDPDQPIITGRVYHGTNKPWQALPGQQKKSYFRDEGGNHISMDATDGAQRIELFSPYANTKLALGAPNSPEGINMSTDADRTIKVGGKSITEVAKDKFEKVGGALDRVVDMNYTDLIKGNVKRGVKGNLTLNVEQALKYTIGDMSNHVHIGESVDVFMGFEHKTTFGLQTELSRSKVIRRVWSDENVKNHSAYTSLSDGDAFIGSKAEYKIMGGGHSGGQEIILDGKKVVINAGENQIVINKDGTIEMTVVGDLLIQTKGKLHINADKEINLLAPKVKGNKGTFQTKNIKDG